MVRLYTSCHLSANAPVSLTKDQQHYLTKVMRFKDGDCFYAFNETDGEWKVQFSKIQNLCIKQQRIPPSIHHACWLVFTPLKHDALTFLVEKATELQVTDLQPIITQHTNSHRFPLERVEKNTIEAAQQSERLTIPKVHAPVSFEKFIQHLPRNIHWYTALERSASKCVFQKPAGFIIGPEGGWSAYEKIILQEKTTPFSLGSTILRAETAALSCLSLALYT